MSCRWRLEPIWVGALISMAPAMGCIDPDAFSCSDDTQCLLAGGGQCHGNGACSYPSDHCASRRVWSRNAGVLAGQCVDPEQGATGSSGVPQDGSGSPTGDAASDGGSGAGGVCGDDNLDPMEECDDGDLEDGDGCNADCRLSGRVLWSTTVEVHAFDNKFNAVTITDEGEIVGVGYTSSEAAVDQFDSDQYDFLVARHSGAGDELAVLSEAHGGRDELRCVFVGTDSQVFVGGERSATAGAELWVGRVETDAFVTEVAYADVEARQTVAQDCVGTPDGKIVAVGMLDGGMGDGYESWDRLIVYDPLGNGWTQHLPGDVPLRDVAYAVEVQPDGRVLVAGSTSRTLAEASDRWITLLEADGTEVSPWPFVDSGPGGGQEEVFGATVVGSTVFAVGATVINQGNVEREWMGALDLRTAALPQEDDLQLRPPSTISALAADPGGNLVLCGSTGAAAAGRGFVAKFDPSARERRWLQDDLGAVRASDVAVDTDGTIIVVGSTVARGDNGPAYIARLAP